MKVTLKNEVYKNLKEKWKNPKFRKVVKSDLIKLVATIVFTFIYGIGMNWFLLSSSVPLYSGGVPGFSQLLVDIFEVSGVVIPSKNIILGVLVFALNIPIILLGWFKVSKRFTIFSLISVIIQSTALSFLPSPDAINSLDPLLNSIIGGTFVGIGIGGTLRYGSSTGGFDIFGQYLAHKTGKSVGFISTAINVAITIIGSFVLSFGVGTTIEFVSGAKVFRIISEKPIEISGFENIVIQKNLIGAEYGFAVFSYTSIRLLITMVVTDRLHTIYNFMEVNIISDKPIEISEVLINELGRGVTLFDIRGGYGYNEKQMIYLIIFAHEVQNLKDVLKEHDPSAFVVFKNISSVVGNFKKKTL